MDIILYGQRHYQNHIKYQRWRAMPTLLPITMVNHSQALMDPYFQILINHVHVTLELWNFYQSCKGYHKFQCCRSIAKWCHAAKNYPRIKHISSTRSGVGRTRKQGSETRKEPWGWTRIKTADQKATQQQNNQMGTINHGENTSTKLDPISTKTRALSKASFSSSFRKKNFKRFTNSQKGKV